MLTQRDRKLKFHHCGILFLWVNVSNNSDYYFKLDFLPCLSFYRSDPILSLVISAREPLLLRAVPAGHWATTLLS